MSNNLNINVNGKRVVTNAAVSTGVGGLGGLILWFFHLITWKWILLIAGALGMLGAVATIVHDSSIERSEPQASDAKEESK